MANITNQIWQDAIAKMYGSAFAAPQQSMAGLGSAANAFANRYGAEASRQGSLTNALIKSGTDLAPTAIGTCCFNFLEAEGEIYCAVRRYRDKHYSKTGAVSIGYVRSARILVPLMQRYPWFKRVIRLVMTRPLKAYACWHYGENRSGFLLWPIKVLWINLWRGLGVT